MSKRVALVVFPGFQMLDLAALTVFEIANLMQQPAPYALEVVSHSGGMVMSSSGVRIETQAFSTRSYDTVLLAGATEITASEPQLIVCLQRAAQRARRIASICTGAFILAEAGLLGGYRVTTHWAHAHELKRRHPEILIDDDKIFVHDRALWTSAGMTACIDLALALVDDDLGPELAKAVARKLVIYHRRTGGQSQFATMSELEPGSDRIRDALNFAKENLREPLTVEQLANHVHWSPRHFSRAFQLQTGHSPAKAIEKLRLEAARALLEDGHVAISNIAMQTGFGDEERMRRAFLRTLGKPPQALLREARLRQQPLAAQAA
ncbi:GlxA family transcriptional regulator [Herbaspirillum autotrophicum]|uniref:GlxA family transcriptional regulator n=1 Tax=Herbaspirillum autotrophicum TaxID=180195 RepID=UPI00067C2E40|nr:GlxA family transcriptional regulator [Herbaspirillum autotrophicum]